MIKYFENKYYLLDAEKRRLAHVHILDDMYKVCGHIGTKFNTKKFYFTKEEFEKFLNNHELEME
ncbi:SAV1978 family virulence-associated passenger protein [uncultured Staphylococcus sp.]|uniref:SAV1978 family virulence-associated passenger protein n=1 Tax=uncultured Staphylococcus sp. TaxID=189668 RepID=UPI0025DEA8F3|nr:SAV1978 family virulence-associated passenger protein [uncultured Staphylococcus sp.]